MGDRSIEEKSFPLQLIAIDANKIKLKKIQSRNV